MFHLVLFISTLKPYEITLEIGVTVEKMNSTLVDTRHHLKELSNDEDSSDHVRNGGSYVQNLNGITLFGTVWNSYELEKTYIIDQFSRLKVDIQIDREAIYLGVCVSDEMHQYVFFKSDNDNDNDNDNHIDDGDNSYDKTACFHLYGDDTGWNDAGFLPIQFNLALGKPTVQSSTAIATKLKSRNGNVYGNGAPPSTSDSASRNAVDSEYNSVAMSDVQTDPYWEVDLEGEFMLGSIVLHRNLHKEYIYMDSGKDIRVEVRDRNNQLVLSFSITMTLNQSKVALEAPFNTRASKVKVIFHGERRVLSLAEVEVWESNSHSLAGKRSFDIPMGSLLAPQPELISTSTLAPAPALLVKYVTFVQGSKEGTKSGSGSPTASHLSDMKFIFGSINDPET